MKVVVVFGGRSEEHEISVISAKAVCSALKEAGHQVIPLAVDKEGRWCSPRKAWDVLDGTTGGPDTVPSFEGTHRLAPELLDWEGDVVFPVLHGPYGEDGTLQGLLELLGLPYVGCGVAASALCMDKALSKRVLSWCGLPTAEWVEVESHEFEEERDAVLAKCLALPMPVFVKPARLGSSVGVSKVNTASALAGAIEHALKFDSKAVVERGIDAREIEVAVLGNAYPEASLPGEIVPSREFYDYADKYLEDAAQLLAPAPLPDELVERARQLAVEAYRCLGCRGMARVDLFLERKSSVFVVNEINTIPGFTPISMFPRLWDLSGVPYPELVDRLVRLALE